MAKHASNIRKRKDGRWEARYSVFDQGKGRRVYKSVYGSTCAEVSRKLERALSERRPAILPPAQSAENCTFQEAAELWLHDVRRKRKYSTYVKYATVYERHLKELFGDMRIDQMCGTQIAEQLSARCQERKLSAGTIHGITTVLSQIVRSAGYPMSLAALNSALSDISQSGERMVKQQIFSRTEQSHLLTFLQRDPDPYKLGVVVCLFTGMRIGEICALETSDILVSEQKILVTKTVQRIKSPDESISQKTTLLVSNPKSARSVREIPLCEPLRHLFEEYAPQSRYFLARDKPADPRTFQYKYRSYLKQSQIRYRSFHCLRHSFATNCINGGMDPKVLSEILGHADVRTTLNLYVHPTLEMKQKQLDCALKQFGAALQKGSND